MNRTNNSDCPDQQTLLQFIQGRLDPPKLTDCESHLSDCEVCHETLRGLDTSDTLSQHVSDALRNAKPVENISDTQAIDGLMQRLLQPNPSRSSSIKKSSADAEIMADRAAEVLRCIEPPAIGDESLGRLGDYELLRLIGAGGTGVVFMAKDRTLDRMVALKVLRPSLGALARDRFIAEAKLAASIEHDNIVTIYQIGQQDRLAFIAMQWLPGETLEARLIRESGPLHENTIREFVAQIASGLSAAHARQLIHRDIKPANIWICEEDDRIKILDFGLARVTDEDSSFTQTGMLAGTPNFMSPEQARGLELDSRSDLFSLGCVMYQMLTGKLPFSAPTILATLQTIQSESPQPPIAANADCDADLSDLTMSLLEKLPGNRLESAQTLVTCLQHDRSRWPQSVATVSGKAPAVDITPKPSTSSARSPSTGLRWLAAGLVGLVSTAAWLMAPQIFRIATNQGELVIETSDENIKVQVLENGDLVRVLDASTKDSFDIQSGEYTFNVVSDDNQSEFEVTPKSVKMTRGGRQLVTVTISEAKAKETVENGTRSTSDSNTTVFPYEAFAAKGSTSVYGLNAETAKTTGFLDKGEKVEVYKQTDDGWCAIKPPEGSFSFLKKSAVSRLGGGGEIATVSVDRTRVWVGTLSMITPIDNWNPIRHSSATTHSGDLVSQVELNKGDRVSITAEVHIPVRVGNNVSFNAYYQIEPPAGEFRWVRKSDLKTIIDNVATADPILEKETALVNSAEAADKLEKQKIIELFRNADTPEKRQQALDVTIATLNVQRDVLVDRLGTGHPKVQEFDSQIASLRKNFEPFVSKNETPIYGGQDFDQWLRIAKTDREPKTVADAIAACGVLAEGEQKERFLDHFRYLIRQHGNASGNVLNGDGPNTISTTYFAGFIKAIKQLEPEEVVAFIQNEMEFGNERSLGFCSRLFYNDFYEAVQKAVTFRKIVELDANPMLRRICDNQLKVDLNLRSFLEIGSTGVKVSADTSLCKKVIESVEIAEKPSLYYTMWKWIGDDALYEAFESDFFDASTPGEVRESFVHYLSPAFDVDYRRGGGGSAKSGYNTPSRRTQAIRILTKAISEIFDSEKPNLEFDSYEEIWFDENRVVNTTKNKNGEMFWEDKAGRLQTFKPENAQQIQGRAAVVRHLLTKLCQYISDETLLKKDRELVRSFIKELTSNKELKAFENREELEELQIVQDLKTLNDIAIGTAKVHKFSHFATKQTSGPFGGGRGFGGGGGGGVF